jgi:hypothetical protein
MGTAQLALDLLHEDRASMRGAGSSWGPLALPSPTSRLLARRAAAAPCTAAPCTEALARPSRAIDRGRRGSVSA